MQSFLVRLIRSVALINFVLLSASTGRSYKALMLHSSLWQFIHLILVLCDTKCLVFVVCFSCRYWILRSCLNTRALWQVSLFIYHQKIDLSIDGLKRLRLTPKLFDWLIDASHFFPTAAARQFLDIDCDMSDFSKFPGRIPRTSNLVGSWEKGGKAPPLTKSCMCRCLFTVFEVV